MFNNYSTLTVFAHVRACMCVYACVGIIVFYSSISLFIHVISYLSYVIMLCVFYVMLSFFSCWPFVVEIVDALVVAMLDQCENHTLIVLLDSCTPTGGFE